MSSIPTADAYRAACFAAQSDPNAHWLGVAQRLVWSHPPPAARGDDGRWFTGGTLNAAESCVDRHLYSRGDQAALIWEGDASGESLTYQQLYERVGTLSSALKSLGATPGSRAILYMGTTAQAAIALLACARLGVAVMPVHPTVHAEDLRRLITAFQPTTIITANEARLAGRTLPTKATLDRALEGDKTVQLVLVARRTEAQIRWSLGRDIWWEHALTGMSPYCAPVAVPAAAPLLLLPAAEGRIAYPLGGFLAHADWATAAALGLVAGDRVACAVALSSLAGLSAGLLGPLSMGCTVILSETPPARLADFVARHQPTVLYAPAAMLADSTALPGDSLRVIAAAGALPAAASAALSGPGRAIVGTWMSEAAGGFCLATFPGAVPGAPGRLGLALPGLRPLLLGEHDQPIHGPATGRLVLEGPWPGQAWVDGPPAERLETGLMCRRDHQGYLTLL